MDTIESYFEKGCFVLSSFPLQAKDKATAKEHLAVALYREREKSA